MRITVFGATGGTGKQLVERALASGYAVVVYARNPSKLNIENEHLTILSPLCKVNCPIRNRLSAQ